MSAPAPDDRGLPPRIYLLSQAARPAEVRSILLTTALKDGWMPLVINLNLSIFVGMIALTAGFGAVQSLVFLAIHLTASTAAMSLYLLMQWRKQSHRDLSEPLVEQLLTFNDMLMMLSWSGSLLLFIAADNETRTLLLVLLLAVAGIASAALNAKTFANLMIGRLALFGPAAVFVVVTRIELWPLFLASICVGAAVSIGIGYAVHVQLLNEANLVLRMRDTNDLLQQTARQERAAQARLLQEAQVRERFLHSINHDLAQPLAGLDMCLFGLERQNRTGPTDETLSTARKCLETAKALIADVSDMARLQGQRPQPLIQSVDIGPLLADLRDETAPLALHKGVDLRVVASAARVRADPQMLRRVLRNLVFNAVEFTDAGRILIGVRRRGPLLALVVADTGIGIARDQQSHVFEAFHRATDADGGDTPHIGLGLAIVHSLVSAMGGTVHLSSQPGRGTLFEVRLPAASDSAASPAAGAVARPGPELAAKGRVLLVEDDPAWRRRVAAQLVEQGLQVDAPGDPAGFAGLPLDGYDLLVFDFSLGPDLTALDLLRRLPGAMLPRTLVISEHADAVIVEQITRLGAGFAPKPLTARRLQDWLADRNG